MITDDTVLILGAGASHPFGFPLGTKLVDDIVEFIQSPYDFHLLALVKEITSTTDDTLNKFLSALNYSGKKSIDSFLENRVEFMELGKALIACVLCRHEVGTNIFTSRSDSNWYYYLFEKMGNTQQEIGESFSNLSIITFNYDRSLEYFFYHALKNSFGLDSDECRSMISRLNIIHFYGQLGALKEIEPTGRNFKNKLGKAGLVKCIEGINLIRDGQNQQSSDESLDEYLSEAKRIFFLGFGYDGINLKRLRIHKYITPNAPNFSGSAYKLTKHECINIVEGLLGLPRQNYLHLDNIDGEILDFLRAHTPFDSSWRGVIKEHE